MTREELKLAANSLPTEPGVYLMKDASDTVIYVGKAKKLKNRVSQYFQDSASHTAKTRRMVSLVDHFETIRAASEFEALVLECSLIKHYMPKYNILLKDDKGYPYLRLDLQEPYPKITLANRVKDDGAVYFGPYGSRGRSQQVIQTIQTVFRLPGCNKKFPRDIGKDRPCLNFHMKQCDGFCRPEMPQAEYRRRMEQAKQLLEGKQKPLCAAPPSVSHGAMYPVSKSGRWRSCGHRWRRLRSGWILSALPNTGIDCGPLRRSVSVSLSRQAQWPIRM